MMTINGETLAEIERASILCATSSGGVAGVPQSQASQRIATIPTIEVSHMNYKNEKLDLLLLLATAGMAEAATAAGHDFFALFSYILLALFGLHTAATYTFKWLALRANRKLNDGYDNDIHND